MAEVSVSILDIKKKNVIKTFYNVETAKIDYFHVDLMDGEFVEKNNVEQMKDYALKIHSVCMTPFEVHLMAKTPEDFLDYFIDQGVDRIIFHLEACENKDKVLDIVKYLIENGIKAGIAVSPETEIEKVYEFLPYIHMVLVMTVIPGLGGQKLIPETIEKVKKLNEYCNNKSIDIDIEVDGGINDVTAKEAVDNGANVLVVGSYIWNSNNCSEAVKILKDI